MIQRGLGAQHPRTRYVRRVVDDWAAKNQNTSP